MGLIVGPPSRGYHHFPYKTHGFLGAPQVRANQLSRQESRFLDGKVKEVEGVRAPGCFRLIKGMKYDSPEN